MKEESEGLLDLVLTRDRKSDPGEKTRKPQKDEGGYRGLSWLLCSKAEAAQAESNCRV